MADKIPIWQAGRTRRYPWDEMKPGDWFEFPEDVKLASARVAAYTAGRAGQKFNATLIDGKICCRRVDGLATEPSIEVRPSDTFPETSPYRTARVRYPWKEMEPGEWFVFPPNIAPQSARVMAYNAGMSFSLTLHVYRSVAGDLICRRIDDLPERERFPEKKFDRYGNLILPAPRGGQNGTQPVAWPDNYGPDNYTTKQHPISRSDTLKNDFSLMDQPFENLLKNENTPAVDARIARAAAKYPEFVAQNFRTRREAMEWITEKMNATALGDDGEPRDMDHPFYFIEA